MKKNLFLITSLFPYGHGETFLETEILYASDFFENIYIIPLNKTKKKRSTPENCFVLPYVSIKKWYFFKILICLFDTYILKELIGLIFKKNKIGILKTMILTLNKGLDIKQFLLKKISEEKIHNALFYSYWCDESALALALIKKKYPKIKNVSRAHRWDLYFETNRYNHLPFKPFITKFTNTICPISNSGKKYIEKYWNTYKYPKVAFLGVHLNSVLKINTNEFILVSCSNIIKVKRIELILNTLKQIKDVSIKWVHFGDGPEFEKLQNSSEKINKNIQIEWKGRVDNEKIINFYKSENPSLFINVSNSEGIPVSIMEAFSFGIPVIATNVGGTNELVKDGYNGLLLNENPIIDEIKSAILKIRNLEVSEYEKMKRNAWNTINKKFNAEKNYTLFYKNLLDF